MCQSKFLERVVTELLAFIKHALFSFKVRNCVDLQRINQAVSRNKI